MPTYSLKIDLFSVFTNDIPTLEILADGVVHSSHSISSSGTTLSLTINYAGALPSSLAFRFDDASTEIGRSIEIQSIKINDRYVNTGNYLSDDSLSNGDTASVDVASSSFIYDDSEPDASEFTPPTVAMTTGHDIFSYNGSADYIIDGLAGSDGLTTGSGNDKINGGAGDDIIRSNAGNDLVYGAEGADRLYGGSGDDTMYGGEGNDRINGDAGDDEIHGNDGADKLYGNDGNDVITGGLGNDTLLGHDGNDFLFGDDGNDALTGHAGNDTLDGGAGNDVLRSGDDDDVLNGGEGLANNTGVSYSADTNSFYQYVNASTTWAGADAAASAATLTGLAGVNGHLVTITSQAENDAIENLGLLDNIWIAASDATTEGEWFWTAGPEAGQQFWTGGAFGSSVNGMYSNWLPLNPSDFDASWDYAEYEVAGLWLSSTGTVTSPGYVIEWEADSLLSASGVEQVLLNGGNGVDTLNGGAGMDLFILDNLNGVDTIVDFDFASRDQIDISSLISGYDPLTDALTDFIQLTEIAGNTTMAIDSDGSVGGSSYTDVAILEGTTGIDLNQLLAGDNLVI